VGRASSDFNGDSSPDVLITRIRDGLVAQFQGKEGLSLAGEFVVGSSQSFSPVGVSMAIATT
jgi:hypothetical protein